MTDIRKVGAGYGIISLMPKLRLSVTNSDNSIQIDGTRLPKQDKIDKHMFSLSRLYDVVVVLKTFFFIYNVLLFSLHFNSYVMNCLRLHEFVITSLWTHFISLLSDCIFLYLGIFSTKLTSTEEHLCVFLKTHSLIIRLSLRISFTILSHDWDKKCIQLSACSSRSSVEHKKARTR